MFLQVLQIIPSCCATATGVRGPPPSGVLGLFAERGGRGTGLRGTGLALADLGGLSRKVASRAL